MRDTHREREREREAETQAGSMQEAWHGTQSPVSRIRPWAEGGAKPLSHLGCPELTYLIKTWQTNLLILDFHQAFLEFTLLFGEVYFRFLNTLYGLTRNWDLIPTYSFILIVLIFKNTDITFFLSLFKSHSFGIPCLLYTSDAADD